MAGRGERRGGKTGSRETSWEMVTVIRERSGDGLEQVSITYTQRSAQIITRLYEFFRN